MEMKLDDDLGFLLLWVVVGTCEARSLWGVGGPGGPELIS